MHSHGSVQTRTAACSLLSIETNHNLVARMSISTDSQGVRFTIPDDLSVYQNVVIGGQVVRQGVRSCEDRWRLIEPHISHDARAVLDVGSNFGWFGLRICDRFPRAIVASMEADLRSAAVQRSVLASHNHERICLLTQTVNATRLRAWASSGQRFDATLVLSVLHWMPDHRQVLAELGRMSEQMFIEVPEPDETAVGLDYVRREIGRIEVYLRTQFPTRSVELLGEVDSPQGDAYSRRLWKVGPASSEAQSQSPGLDINQLLSMRPSWPRRSWWEHQLADVHPCEDRGTMPSGALAVTAAGLRSSSELSQRDIELWRYRFGRLPEEHLDNRAMLLLRRARRAAARLCGI